MKFTKVGGFTLLETLMTMSIAAVVMAIALPSFRYVTNSNRIAAEVNGLLGDLQFARAEAVKEGRNVTVCESQDGLNCSRATTWQNGWIVFSDPTNVGVVDAGETVLRVQPAFSGTDVFNASQNISVITFNRQGYAIAMPAGTLITLQDSTANANWTRCLVVNFSGLMGTGRSGQTINGVACL